MFSRSRPWRPRPSFTGKSAGARRRGHRLESSPVTASLETADDVSAYRGEAALPVADGGLAEALDQFAVVPAAARIDESGLLAIRHFTASGQQTADGGESSPYARPLVGVRRSA
jgi:hypothetical protein